jgi:multisubunit Na+/H+ antiporter MnhE subunit
VKWRFALGWAALFVAWLLLAATYSVAEAIAAAVAASLILLFLVRVGRERLVVVRLRPRWLLRLVKLPWQVAQDLAILARRLCAPRRRGVFRALPFDAAGDDPVAVGRRALLTAAASLGPNTYVVAWDEERALVLVHQLERSPRVLPAEGGTYR